eukprot:scpid34168/ scgid4912/ Sushi, von Willebrand factor type A, EGF and pentraxin domain-containing protein 1
MLQMEGAMIATTEMKVLLLLLLPTLSFLTGAQSYVICSTPVPSKHGGYNYTSPPNQPPFSNGTDLYYYCDRHYMFIGVRVTPVTCGDNGEWGLYGMDTHCYAINCTKPRLSEGSGVTLVGTNYSQGAMIRYECKTGWSTLEPTAICLGPEWSNKYNPWCNVEKCLPLTYGQNTSDIPYGKITVTRLGDYDSSTPSPSWRVRQYQAQVQYSCDPGTELIGSENRTCNATGMWNTNRPICFVQNHNCYANTKCPDGKVCCEWGGEGALGLNCCKPKTKQHLSERFAGLSRQCFHDFNDNFLTCITQIIKCMDDDSDSCVSNWVLRDYLYGCGSNVGDLVPQQRLNGNSDDDLVEFCKRDQRTVACTELQIPYNGFPSTLSARMCLPLTCANSSVVDLHALATSTLKLRCHNQRSYSSYCSIASVTLNCSNGLQATAHQDDGACNQCPPPDGDPSLTECCTYGGKKIGCCLPRVQTMMSEQLEPVQSPVCRNSVMASLAPCVPMIADCLNNLVGTKSDYVCPSYHNCNAQEQRSEQCPTYYAGSNHSLWCQTSCEFPGDRERYCQMDRFCLEQTCNTTTDLKQLAYSDARMICEYTKLTYNVKSCDRVKTTWYCSDQSGSKARSVTAEYTDPVRPLNVGLVVGLTIGLTVLFLGIGAAIHFIILPMLRKRSRHALRHGKDKQTLVNSVDYFAYTKTQDDDL